MHLFRLLFSENLSEALVLRPWASQSGAGAASAPRTQLLTVLLSCGTCPVVLVFYGEPV